ncbi:MAG: transposase [Armatimonadota bacterium]
MATRRRSSPRIRREAALGKLAAGADVAEVAREAGVSEATVRGWRRRVEANPLLTAFFAGRTPARQERLRALRLWQFATTKIMAEKALQEEDVKACDRVLDVLRELESAEKRDEGDAVAQRLGRELGRVRPEVAAEIVRLLAEAGSARARGDGSADDGAAGEKGVGAQRLPWQEDGAASDTR